MRSIRRPETFPQAAVRRFPVAGSASNCAISSRNSDPPLKSDTRVNPSRSRRQTEPRSVTPLSSLSLREMTSSPPTVKVSGRMADDCLHLRPREVAVIQQIADAHDIECIAVLRLRLERIGLDNGDVGVSGSEGMNQGNRQGHDAGWCATDSPADTFVRISFNRRDGQLATQPETDAPRAAQGPATRRRSDILKSRVRRSGAVPCTGQPRAR